MQPAKSRDMIRTELEYCVLGVIWRRGPCSAHMVRNEFARSPSSPWSSSAGSIYPVVARLARARLIDVRARSEGKRTIRDLSITSDGLAELRDWIARMDRQATSATYDSVRTRLLFLRALQSREKREQAYDAAVTETKTRLAELAAAPEEDPMEELARRGAVHELEGRLRWLAEIRPHLFG